MPGNGDEMKIWTEKGKQKVHKHYLTMFLREAYALYLDSCLNDDERCSFTTFSNLQLTNILLMGNSPLHTNANAKSMKTFFLKLEAMGLIYDSAWW